MANKVILEIRAGTGGEEAKLFSQELLRMYIRYCQKQNWSVKNKDLTLEIIGDNAYNQLNSEAGVHRVQRIPITEKSGRIHTSTATVAVLGAEFQKEIEVKPNDLRIETFRGPGPGGQHRNVTDSAVRITHLPSGLVVTCKTEKSQHQNKARALQILENKLKNLERQKYQQAIIEERRQQIGTAERSEKIRTYNFPQNRVTDHRVNKSWQNLDSVLNGDLKKIIKELKQSADAKQKGGEE